MRITFWKLLAPLPLLLLSCSDRSDEGAHPVAKTVRVTVGSGPQIDIRPQAATRSEIGEDGISVKWNTDDRIALWAENTKEGTFAFEAHEFALYHYNATWNAAKFTADIPQMEAGTYNYYAVSPKPAAVDGTRASFDIPAVQDGNPRIPSLVMVADPVAGAQALAEGDNSDMVSLHFTHKVHVLKIAIPSNSLNEPVSELQLTFPEPVVGRLTVDAADPAAEGVLTGGTNTLTLRFAEPKSVGDVVFAAISPINISTEQSIEIRALGQTCESEAAFFAGKDFLVGHTTPIDYNVPAAGRYFTRLRFSLPEGKGVNTLGEEVTRIKLTAPADATFGNNSNTLEFRPDADGSYTIMLLPSWEDRLSGSEVTVEYESESAVVSKSVKFDAVETWSTENVQKLEVPYLYEEYFDNAPSFGYNDNNTTSATSSGSNDYKDLASSYGMPSGWTGARCGASAGKAVRICSRSECAALVYGTYHGRIDAPSFSHLKEGASVKVKVAFKYSMNRNACHGNFLQPYLAFGITANDDRNTSGKAGNNDGYRNHLIPNVIHYDLNDSRAQNGSYDNITLIAPADSFASGVTRQHRLVWEVYMKDNEPRNAFKYYYSNNYVYLDDIQVSIAK